MNNRITSELITKLEPNQIFVFGSNLAGRHGLGAAKTAMGWGARYGQAAGLQGRTYGIPTKDQTVQRVLSINEIKPFVDEFIEFAKENSHLIFLVTEIGCGLSGYKPKHIAPLFKEAIRLNNIHLPSRFWHKLKDTSNMNDFKQYRRKQIAELRPYVNGEVLPNTVSISQADKEAGSPKLGDMIARNPKNYEDQWLVAKQYFEDNFESIG